MPPVQCLSEHEMSPPLHHMGGGMWCNASDSLRTCGSTYQVLYESSSRMIFAISHIPDTHLQGLRQTHVMETIWLILGLCRSRNAARLLKDFVPLSSGALLFVALNSRAHSAHDTLLCFCWGQMPQREIKVGFGRPTRPQKCSSPGLCHPGELRCAGLCYQPSKDSPLILFHVSWSNRTRAPRPGHKALEVEHSRKEMQYACLKRSF